MSGWAHAVIFTEKYGEWEQLEGEAPRKTLGEFHFPSRVLPIVTTHSSKFSVPGFSNFHPDQSLGHVRDIGRETLFWISCLRSDEGMEEHSSVNLSLVAQGMKLMLA